jgi:hypothetical protein
MRQAAGPVRVDLRRQPRAGGVRDHVPAVGATDPERAGVATVEAERWSRQLRARDQDLGGARVHPGGRRERGVAADVDHDPGVVGRAERRGRSGWITWLARPDRGDPPEHTDGCGWRRRRRRRRSGRRREHARDHLRFGLRARPGRRGPDHQQAQGRCAGQAGPGQPPATTKVRPSSHGDGHPPGNARPSRPIYRRRTRPALRQGRGRPHPPGQRRPAGPLQSIDGGRVSSPCPTPTSPTTSNHDTSRPPPRLPRS